jgi:hypothetical protein
MGSAGIGLPFLDKEINEPPPPRLRADGFLSDTEFAAECAERVSPFTASLGGSVRNVAEYSQHARAYARATHGAPIPVTANVFDASAYGLSYLPYIDVFSGEKPGLGLRNDHWYRYAYAYAGGKPTVLTNAPNEYIASINDDMRDGKPDGYLLQVLDAYAQGVCMAVGYGGWLGHLRKDAVWMPKPLADRLGRWLKDNEALFPATPVADTALLFDHDAGLEEELSVAYPVASCARRARTRPVRSSRRWALCYVAITGSTASRSPARPLRSRRSGSPRTRTSSCPTVIACRRPIVWSSRRGSMRGACPHRR